MGTLYLVATPIGNMDDISLRALRILSEVRLIAAEDTRITRKLTSHYGIHTSLTSYFEHNKISKLIPILTALAKGDVALVSDAGTPALNDPGYELVRAAIEHGFKVSPVPGPSAIMAALISSGLPTDSFLYLGYLPRKLSERRKLLKRVSNLTYTLIFLETPHRLLDSLTDLQLTLGNRQITISREMTKIHEEIWRGAVSESVDYFTNKKPRGEFTLVVSGTVQNAVNQLWNEKKLIAKIRKGLRLSKKPSLLSAHLARESGWDRNQVYRLILEQRIIISKEFV